MTGRVGLQFRGAFPAYPYGRQMLRRTLVPIVVLAAALSASACDSAPTQPTPAPTSAPIGTLSVSSFTAGGWHADGRFHYVLRLAVTASPIGAVDVQEVRFEQSTGLRRRRLPIHHSPASTCRAHSASQDPL